MPLLALDDTDTRHSGCTTHTAYRIAHALEHADGSLREWGLVEAPRLVRLNPAAEHRTRGNGALVLPIGRRTPGPGIRIGTWPDAQAIEIPLRPAPHYWPEPGTLKELARLVDLFLPEPGANGRDPQPGAVLLPRPPQVGLYQRAVAQMIRLEEAWGHAPPGALRLTGEARRGEIGALAASAWPGDPTPRDNTNDPNPDTIMPRWSWEYIRYRHASTTHRQQELPTDFAQTLEGLPGGFDNLDTREGRIRAVPRTPCPVLFGVRGRDPLALVDAFARGPPGPAPGWLLLTNHATGDHARYAPPEPGAHQVTRAQVTITARPVRRRGGHVFTWADLDGQTVHLAAFEPTKTLRAPFEATRPGDRLQVLARTRDDAHLLALEAFRVEHLAPREQPEGNPRCPRCHGGTKSRGKEAGYRCPRCRVHLQEHTRAHRRLDPAPLHPGALYQVPDHVRGHLLPPLKGLGPSQALPGGPHKAPHSHRVPPVLDPRMKPWPTAPVLNAQP